MKNNRQHPYPEKNQQLSGVQAVERSLILLQLVAEHEGPISIGELVEKSGMNRTTVWRLLSTLEQHDFIERAPYTKGYQVGYAAIRLGSLNNSFVPLIRRARPTLEWLGELTKETVTMSVPRHTGTLTIFQLDPPHSVQLVDYVNKVLPLHCTSTGKLHLSRFSDEELDIILQKPLERISPLTITDPDLLRKEIEKVRQLGYSTAIGELDENENGISAPIVDHRFNYIAFISVSGPNFRLTKEKTLSLAPVMIKAAKEISSKLELHV